MHLKIPPSHDGSSISQETPIDNHSTHHQDHHQDVPREEVEVEEAEEEVTVEMDYPPHKEDQAYSHHMDEPLTLTNSSVANLNLSQGIEQRSNPS
jgi:hypothetical protein